MNKEVVVCAIIIGLCSGMGCCTCIISRTYYSKIVKMYMCTVRKIWKQSVEISDTGVTCTLFRIGITKPLRFRKVLKIGELDSQKRGVRRKQFPFFGQFRWFHVTSWVPKMSWKKIEKREWKMKRKELKVNQRKSKEIKGKERNNCNKTWTTENHEFSDPYCCNLWN